jgi:hypothetical protein
MEMSMIERDRGELDRTLLTVSDSEDRGFADL